MGKEIYNIINDMAEVLNASQMQKLQEVLVNRLSENEAADYQQTGNTEFFWWPNIWKVVRTRPYAIISVIFRKCWRQKIFRL